MSAEAGYTMGLTFADVDNTGTWNLHLSNMYSHAGGRIVPLATSLDEETRERLSVLRKGGQVFTRVPGSAPDAWDERGSRLGVDDSGWSWGSVFLDVENDGDKDLFVVNGYQSNRDAEAPDW